MAPSNVLIPPMPRVVKQKRDWIEQFALSAPLLHEEEEARVAPKLLLIDVFCCGGM